MMDSNLDIKVNRIYKVANENSVTKAFADISINDELLIKGFRVVEGKQGVFVSMPQQKSKDSRWFDSVRCLNLNTRESISERVLSAFNSEEAVVN